jgi:hypothetical protein
MQLAALDCAVVIRRGALRALRSADSDVGEKGVRCELQRRGFGRWRDGRWGYIGGLAGIQHGEGRKKVGGDLGGQPRAHSDVEPEVAHALPVLLDNVAALVARVGVVVGVAAEPKEAVVPRLFRLGAGAAPVQGFATPSWA